MTAREQSTTTHRSIRVIRSDYWAATDAYDLHRQLCDGAPAGLCCLTCMQLTARVHQYRTEIQAAYAARQVARIHDRD